jgi:magnesium transporter
MLTVYDSVDGKLIKRDAATGIGEHPVWIDLFMPTKDEDLLVEQTLGVKIPTREEMQEIEVSSRLYQEGGAHYMTAVVLHMKTLDQPAADVPVSRRAPEDSLPQLPAATPVTFVLAKNALVTVRYEMPRALEIFISRNQKGDIPCTHGCMVLVGLLEAVIDREADRVERVQSDIDGLGHKIFDVRGGQRSKSRRFDLAVKAIGRGGEITTRSRESLQSLDRLLTYLAFVMGERNDDKHMRARVKTASRDVGGLNDQVSYLSNKLQFLLDATLGMISIEQNNIIKFFTVVSVALMPPTLIASIYGMNFKAMPELDWKYGYPMAIILMIISALVPFLWFRKRGWL